MRVYHKCTRYVYKQAIIYKVHCHNHHYFIAFASFLPDKCGWPCQCRVHLIRNNYLGRWCLCPGRIFQHPKGPSMGEPCVEAIFVLQLGDQSNEGNFELNMKVKVKDKVTV
jgi:hypothetical protein